MLQEMMMPGYRVYEYNLILNPHEELRNKMAGVREEFNKNYSVEFGIKATPNLGIASFKQFAMKESRILEKLRKVALSMAPFKVELSNFGNYPSHTIFFNVTTKTPIQDLVRAIKTESQLLMKLSNDAKPHFFDDPHITIARKLKPWQFEKGWLEFSHRHFTGRFIADRMLLLRRDADTKGPWQILESFSFDNMYVPTTKQGELFG